MENKSKCYTRKEKLLLIELIKENPIVENKKTDAVSIQEKKEAWQTICQIYNAQPDVETQRDSNQLRKLWNNLKQRKRKETTEIKHSMLLTGGGPMIKVVSDPVMDSIEDAAPNMDITIDNPWDSDILFELEGNTPTEPSIKVGQSIKVHTNKLVPLSSQPQPSISSSEAITPTTRDVVDAGICNNANTNTMQTPRKFRSAAEVKKSKDAYVKKTEDARQQQFELHNIKMEIAKEELLKMQLEKEKAQFELQKAKAEAELAILKLNQYKNLNKI